jgi:glutaredoxin
MQPMEQRHSRRAWMSVEGVLPVPQSVVLYRMILPEHTCPYGVEAARLLEEAGIEFEDRILRSREEVDAFQDEHGVDTTPQLFVDGKRIGGSEETLSWLQSQKVG